MSRRRLHLITRYSALIAAALAIAWAAYAWRDPGLPWEAAITFVVSAAAYLVQTLGGEGEGTLSPEEEVQRANDAQLFSEFANLLPSEGPIEFAKNQDFLATFPYEQMAPFNTFSQTWNNPAHEFSDRALEAQRINLLRACSYFTEAIAFKTAPRQAGLQSVVPQHIAADGPFPDWIKKDAREIRDAARAVVDEHQKMMRLGRKKVRLQSPPRS